MHAVKVDVFRGEADALSSGVGFFALREDRYVP